MQQTDKSASLYTMTRRYILSRNRRMSADTSRRVGCYSNGCIISLLLLVALAAPLWEKSATERPGGRRMCATHVLPNRCLA